MDIAIHAVKRVAAIRLGERCQGKDFEITGVPHTLEGKRFDTPTPLGRQQSPQHQLEI